MANQIQVFQSPQFGQVRTAGTSDNPQFCLADICRVLDLQSSAVMRRLQDDVITSHPITDSLGREQVANFVNEDGLYDVILDSRKPEAKQLNPQTSKGMGLKDKFEIEKAAKNRAYSFIIAMGLLSEYQ